MNARRLSLALLLLLGSACTGDDKPDPTDAGPPDATQTPDNCTPEMACTLTPGVAGQDYISPVADTDDWTFSVPAANKLINVTLSNDSAFSQVRYEIALFEPGGTSIANERFTGPGTQRVEIQLVAPAAGTYKITVRDVGNDGADRLNPYFLTVQILDETDNNEPNESAAAATPLIVGTAGSGTIGFEGDEDWFSIDVPSNQLIQIAMSVTGASPVDLKWELWEGTGTDRIAESNEPADGMWRVESRAVGNQGGTYLIRVIDNDRKESDLERPYVLTVTFVTEPDQFDLAAPNETQDTATQVTAGQAVSGYVAATSDFDYYAIQVTNAPQLIEVSATLGVSDVDLAFTLLAPDGMTDICDARDGDACRALRLNRDGSAAASTLTTAHVAMTAGTYYVLVRDHQDNDFDYQSAYSLTVNLPAEPQANEDYDLMGRDGALLVQPTTSTAGTTIQYPWVEGYISHANDIDWWRFDIPGPEFASPGQNGDWLIQLELEIGATPVELEAFFFGTGRSYNGYGKRCRDPMNDPDPCQFPDAENAINETFGESFGDCFVVFREITTNGPHFFRMTDLDGDDFDLRANLGRYRFRITLTAGCPVPGQCEGIFEQGGMDLCGRP